jgi:hypothetical protein
MGRLTTTTLLFLLFSLACRPATQSPVLAPDHVSKSESENTMRLEIQPAMAEAPGGSRVPLRFTIRNMGDQPIHTCLSAGHVIHLWELKRDYGYTLSQQRVDQPFCEQPFDLAPHGEHSWTEEITIPAITAGPARIVGFTQIVPAEPCDRSDCEPVWLSAAFEPFEIEEGAKKIDSLDLRTGMPTTGLVVPAEAADESDIER